MADAAASSATAGRAPLPVRRSFVRRELEAAGAAFGTGAEAALALGFPGAGDEAGRAGRCGVADLSPLWRAGFKGRDALAWLRLQNLAFDERPNRASRQPDGTLVAVLAPNEALLLGPLEGAGLFEPLEAGWSFEAAGRCYPVPRRDSHYWFAVTGAGAPALFAKLCGVDLRPRAFAPGDVAQTSVARTNAIVARADRGGTAVPAFHLLGDGASAAFMWGVLLDAAREFGGGPVGLAAVRGLGGT